MADPGPAFRRGPARARASALSDSVIVYDGSRLLHWLNPLTGAEPEWAAMPDAGADPIACLTSCRDLNNHHDQLFAATESRTLLSWTWRGTNDGGWYAWPSISLDTEPRALASWSLAPGHQQLVVAGADGQVVSQRREDWADWSAWELIGVIREVVALDALVSATGAVELYAVTADGELKRKINRSPLSPSGGWGGVETVTGWAEPAIALSSWSSPGRSREPGRAAPLRCGASALAPRRIGRLERLVGGAAVHAVRCRHGPGRIGQPTPPAVHRGPRRPGSSGPPALDTRRRVAALGAGDRGVDLLDHRADRSADRDRDSGDHRRTGSAVPG